MRPAALPLFCLLIVSAPEFSGPGDAADSESGKDSFLRHCALCHGASGRGDGPVANALKVAPADLTALASRHSGQFPSAKVADVIRNGGGVLGHGTLEMPAWGSVFGEKGNPAAARARIGELVRYLEKLQAK